MASRPHDGTLRMAKKKKMGRPPLPKNEKKRHIVAFKVDDGELKAIDRKARELKLSRSEVVREVVMKFVGPL